MDYQIGLGQKTMAKLDEYKIPHGFYSVHGHGISIDAQVHDLTWELYLGELPPTCRDARILLGSRGSFFSEDLRRQELMEKFDEFPEWAAYIGYWRVSSSRS